LPLSHVFVIFKRHFFKFLGSPKRSLFQTPTMALFSVIIGQFTEQNTGFTNQSSTYPCGNEYVEPRSKPKMSVFAHSQLMWFLADVLGLFSVNVVSFSFNLGQSARIFSINLVPKNGCSQFL